MMVEKLVPFMGTNRRPENATYLTTLKPCSWKAEKQDQMKGASEGKTVEIVKDQVASLRVMIESPQT